MGMAARSKLLLNALIVDDLLDQLIPTQSFHALVWKTLNCFWLMHARYITLLPALVRWNRGKKARISLQNLLHITHNIFESGYTYRPFCPDVCLRRSNSFCKVIPFKDWQNTW
jgi:hypothetical protein